MRKSLASLAFVGAALSVAGQASALPFVEYGSTYTVYLQGTSSDDTLLARTRFDNVTETAVRNNLTLFFSESETALDPTSSRITLNVSANGDMFPSPNETAVLGIGVDGDGLNLLSPVFLTDARLTLRDESGNVLFASDNLAGSADQNAPWDGTFFGVDDPFGVEEIGGMDVANITFDFYVSQQQTTNVPEPGTLFLSGLGLFGLGALRRRWSRSAH